MDFRCDDQKCKTGVLARSFLILSRQMDGRGRHPEIGTRFSQHHAMQLILSAAGTLLAYITFVHQASTQETQELQTMVESAVSNDVMKERTAVRLVNATQSDGLRSRIRLYLTRALVTKDKSVHESSLQEIAQISAANADLEEDTQQLLDSVARNLEDTDLRNAVEIARTRLALLREKQAAHATKRS